MAGKTLGLIGFGRLGKLVARYGKAFGMSVAAYDPYLNDGIMRKFRVKKVTLSQLLKSSDVVSVHAVFNDSTREMLQERDFQLMKPSALFINTARGELTNEQALLKALEKGWIAGAALDTLADESPEGGHLRGNALVEYPKTHENLIIVPHLGGATKEATEKTQLHISDLVIKALRTMRLA